MNNIIVNICKFYINYIINKFDLLYGMVYIGY